MTVGADREHGRGADGTGAGGAPQDAGVAGWLAAAVLVGWTALALAGGGLHLGRLPPGPGASGLTWALVAGPVLAVAALWWARRDRWGTTTVVAVAAFGAFVGWSGLSILWASAPDLAWLSTNRATLYLAALVTGVALARRVADPAAQLAMGLSAACVPILAWALGSRVLPDLLAPFDDTARLAAPIGHANGLALVATLAVPGALVAARDRRWCRAATGLLAAALAVLALTGSRSGLLALIATVAIAFWLLPDRPAMLASLTAAIIGAVPAVAFGLTAGPLVQEPFLPPPADRRGVGLLLGLLLAAGITAAVLLRDPLLPASRRAVEWGERRHAGPVLLFAAGILVVAGGAMAVLRGRDASSGAGRVISLDSNNRRDWWEQAVRGFADAPLHGNGAGSFPLTHIAERTAAFDTLRVRQPHQVVLELLTEVGVVGLILAAVSLAAVAVAARRGGRATGPAVCIIVGFLVQAQLDVPWTIPAIVVPVMLAAGVILASDPPPVGSGDAAWARVAVAAVLGVATIASATVVAVASDRAGGAYLADRDPAVAVARARNASDINPFAIGALLVEARGRVELGDRAGAIRAAHEATDRQPRNPFAWECLASVAGDGPVRDEALRRLGTLDPQRIPEDTPTCQPGW